MNDEYGLAPKTLAAALAIASSLGLGLDDAAATPLAVYPGWGGATVTITIVIPPPPSLPPLHGGVSPCDNGADTDACSTAA